MSTIKIDVPDFQRALREVRQYSIAEATEHLQQMRAIRYTSAFRQTFIAEFAILITIAQYLRDPHIKISYLGMSQAVDGRFLLGREGRTQYIELTIPTDTHEVLFAPATKPVDPKLLNTVMRRLKRRIADKARALEARPHYDGAWLGVVLDDYAVSKERKKRRLDPIFTTLLTDPVAYAPFSRVFCLIPDGEYLFDSASIASPANPS